MDTWRWANILVCVCMFVHARVEADDTGKKPRLWRVETLRIEGNRVFRRWELQPNLYLAPEPFRHPPFSRTMLRRDSLALLGFYREHGYFRTRLATIVHAVDSVEKTVQVLINIDEGPRTFISDVSIEGPYPVHHQGLLPTLEIAPGNPLTLPRLRNDLRYLEDYFGRQGHLNTRPDYEIEFSEDTLLAHVSYTYGVSPLSVVTDIEISGLENTGRRPVVRELMFSTGDTITQPQLSRSVDNLYNTRLFSFVSINFLPQTEADSTLVRGTVRVKVSEAGFLKPSLSAHYDSYQGFESSLEITHANLGGIGLQGRIGGELSDVTQQAYLGLSYPRLLALPVTIRSMVAYGSRNEEAVRLQTDQLSVRSFIGDHISAQVRTGLTHRWERSVHSRAVRDLLHLQKTNAFGLKFVTDQRDMRFAEERKHYLESSVEVGLPGHGYSRFVRSEHEYRFSRQVRNAMAFTSRIRAGMVFPYAPTEHAPQTEVFYLGGSEILRGYREKQAGPTAAGIPQAGNLFFAANVAQVEFPVYRWINGTMFLDAGALWDLENPGIAALIQTPSVTDILYNAGAGLRIRLPLVMVRLDIGLKLNPSPDDKDYWAMHLRIGQKF